MGVLGVGHGKLLLFGEHAAVYGYPAVGTGLPLLTELAGEGGGAVPSLPKTELPAALHELAGAAARRAGGALVVRSALPPGVGLGSSAALCVALARAASMPQVWATAHGLERAFHGSPSGVDTGLAQHTGVAALRWPVAGRRADGDMPLPTLTRLAATDLHLVFGAVPRATSTAASVRRVGDARAAGDVVVGDALAELGSISAAAVATFAPVGGGAAAGGGGLGERLGEQLGELASRAQRLLTHALGLGDGEQSRLLDVGQDAGAAGGKLSGGGGGGAFVLFCSGEAVAERVFDAVRGAASPSLAPLAQLAVSARAHATAGTALLMRQEGAATTSAVWRP